MGEFPTPPGGCRHGPQKVLAIAQSEVTADVAIAQPGDRIRRLSPAQARTLVRTFLSVFRSFHRGHSSL
jgi:hypothetical protein